MQGRIQFFIDALDKAARSGETEVFINRFPIDLELELGANFTERTTYTGIYNISGVEFDMSFKVQCSENYYGPNCTIVCEPVEGLYNCNSEGEMVCVHDGQHITKDSYCALCLDPKTNCSATTTASTTSTNTSELDTIVLFIIFS